jgi:RNA polymerase sigma-70 factor (ECF subfamily)
MKSSALAMGNVGRGGFATTRWTLIRAATERAKPEARQALERLCQLYWFPVYAHIRRKGNSADQSADLTQAFFAHMLESDALDTAEPERGRFRSFLLTCADHFLANEHHRETAQKRGGGRSLISIDVRSAEGRLLKDPADGHTPERAFERSWALALLERVFEQLKHEYNSSDKAAVFARLHVFLPKGERTQSYRDVALELRMTEAAVKVAVHRMRTRFGAILRDEILETVERPEDIDEEIKRLFEAVSR